MNQRQIINDTMYRVRQVYQQFGTITDKTLLETSFQSDPTLETPPITQTNIQVFRRIVSTGIMTNALFRPPAGHKVLGFLIALYNLQQQQLQRLEKIGTESLEEAVAEMWLMKFKKHDGRIKDAQKEVKDLFGTPDEYTAKLLNQSYTKARKQWVAQQTTQQ